MTARPEIGQTRRCDALKGRAFTGQTQYGTSASTRSVRLQASGLASRSLSTVLSNRCSKTRLYVDESPPVTSHDIAVDIDEIDVHRHRDGLLGHEEGDTVVNGVLERPALCIREAHPRRAPRSARDHRRRVGRGSRPRRSRPRTRDRRSAAAPCRTARRLVYDPHCAVSGPERALGIPITACSQPFMSRQRRPCRRPAADAVARAARADRPAQVTQGLRHGSGRRTGPRAGVPSDRGA